MSELIKYLKLKIGTTEKVTKDLTEFEINLTKDTFLKITQIVN